MNIMYKLKLNKFQFNLNKLILFNIKVYIKQNIIII